MMEACCTYSVVISILLLVRRDKFSVPHQYASISTLLRRTAVFVLLGTCFVSLPRTDVQGTDVERKEKLFSSHVETASIMRRTIVRADALGTPRFACLSQTRECRRLIPD